MKCPVYTCLLTSLFRHVTASWKFLKAAGYAEPVPLVSSQNVCCVPKKVEPWNQLAVGPSGSMLVVPSGSQRLVFQGFFSVFVQSGRLVHTYTLWLVMGTILVPLVIMADSVTIDNVFDFELKKIVLLLDRFFLDPK